MPAEIQRELFREFAQAEASTATRSGGMGLGLVICRRLATLMGGDVRMESAPGIGTTLYLTVPLKTADLDDMEAGALQSVGTAAVLPKRQRPSREVAEREGSVLLLAEDHPINRRSPAVVGTVGLWNVDFLTVRLRDWKATGN